MFYFWWIVSQRYSHEMSGLCIARKRYYSDLASESFSSRDI